MNISVSIQINQPKNLVWAAITDIEHCSNMISSIINLKILAQPEQGIIGLKWTETRRIFGREASETMWITEAKKEQYYCTRAENHKAIYLTKMSLYEIDDKTLLTMSFSSTSESFFVRLISLIMTPFFKKSMLKMLQDDLNDIKHFVEKNHQAN